ncbi:MAG: Abi family protein [Puniceicoccaceae bacterium]|nr:MAG: Abi family protein [Puniceicoccaceae bacterium]
MSKFSSGMKGCGRDRIAEKYGLPDGRIFKSWLRALNYLRNRCTHHFQLWNRNMVDQLTLPNPSYRF